MNEDQLDAAGGIFAPLLERVCKELRAIVHANRQWQTPPLGQLRKLFHDPFAGDALETVMLSASRLKSSMMLNVRKGFPIQSVSRMKSMLQFRLGSTAGVKGCLIRAGTAYESCDAGVTVPFVKPVNAFMVQLATLQPEPVVELPKAPVGHFSAIPTSRSYT